MMKYFLLAAVIGVALVNARPHSVTRIIPSTDAGKVLEAEQQITTDQAVSASENLPVETSVPELDPATPAPFTAPPAPTKNWSVEHERWAEVINEWVDNANYGAYSYDFEEANDNNNNEDEMDNSLGSGFLEEGHTFQGTYTYTDTKDRLVTVSYFADENGIHPSIITYK